ncbi:hypothetical protein LT85_2813 [Collimonas arenae]|uniref:Uncharacterized protein n=1 Tax=Collimonas arenae TaxID=279058 RepID=A0A0A1FBP9_9BURK|nr:hypothetical protein [Collimonas arenae]AIY41971.1 hypothetical protein LT85_2813 [Collimonas arenae]
MYLGEFDFLVRRNISGLKFLSIWNETIEELIRGPSLDNINRLFVSFVPPDGATCAAIEQEIVRAIKSADDSYRIVFVTPAILDIGLTIAAEIARIHDAQAVKKQILDVLLNEYGEKAVPIRAGMLVVKYKVIYELLKKSVQALQDSGSDFSVVIAPMQSKQLPIYITEVDNERFVINAGFVRLYNAAWSGESAGPAAESDREPAGISLAEVAEVEIHNASNCRAWAEMTLGLRKHYEEIKREAAR